MVTKAGYSNFVDMTTPGESLYGTPTPELVAEAAIACRMADPATAEGSLVLGENCLVQKMLDAEYPEYRHLVAQGIVHRIRRDAETGTPTDRWELRDYGPKLNKAFDQGVYAIVGQHMGQRLLLAGPVTRSQTRAYKRTYSKKVRAGLIKKTNRSNPRRPKLRSLAGMRLAEWLTKPS